MQLLRSCYFFFQHTLVVYKEANIWSCHLQYYQLPSVFVLTFTLILPNGEISLLTDVSASSALPL